MPRLNDALSKSVFYLYAADPKNGTPRGPMGSGVFIRADDPWSQHANFFLKAGIKNSYAVTARHVVQAGASIIRINVVANTSDADHPVRFEQKSRFIRREPHEWHWIDGGADVAITDVTDDLGPSPSADGYDFVHAISDIDFLTEDFITVAQVTIGEDGFMLGLFTQNPGLEFNHPAARFGNLSQLAKSSIPVEQGHSAAHPSHVFDIHSRPGYSGSPVFIYRTPAFDLAGVEENRWNLSTQNNMFLKLLGIHSGQFHDDVVIQTDGKHKGDAIAIPSSMTVVVPSWEIQKLLELPAIRDQSETRSILRNAKERTRSDASPRDRSS